GPPAADGAVPDPVRQIPAAHRTRNRPRHQEGIPDPQPAAPLHARSVSARTRRWVAGRRSVGGPGGQSGDATADRVVRRLRVPPLAHLRAAAPAISVRIALATDWFAPRVGGIESQLQQLAVRLSERGHSVDVLTTTPGDPGSGGFAGRRLDGLTPPGVGVAGAPGVARAV